MRRFIFFKKNQRSKVSDEIIELAHRCRLGYWKMGLGWPHKSPPGQWICDSTIKLEDVDGLNDYLPKISWLPFRYRSAIERCWYVGRRCESQVVRKAKNSTTDCYLKYHWFHDKTLACPNFIMYCVMWSYHVLSCIVFKKINVKRVAYPHQTFNINPGIRFHINISYGG